MRAVALSQNITVQKSNVQNQDRHNLLGQSGVVIWLTGLSGSGKSTIAYHLERTLMSSRHLTYVLDGDNVRHGLSSDLGFAPQDRTENIRRVSEVAALFADAGIVTVTSFISPYRSDRRMARARIPAGKFIEVYLSTPIAECEKRDPKGLYRKARAGEIAEFTGISAPYETPENAEITIPTQEYSVEQCAQKIVAYLREQKFLLGAKS